MPLRLRKQGEIEEFHGDYSCCWLPDARLTRRRGLRLAVTAIYFTKVLKSLTKKVLENNLRLLRSLSYVAIDVPSEADECVPRIDPKFLSGVVREKGREALAQLGGVRGLAPVLETYLETGLAGDGADIAQRRAVFGENRYTGPPAKRFSTFALEAFKDMTTLILLGCAVLSLVFGVERHGVKEGWYDGGSVIVAVFLVTAVSSISNYKQSRQRFQKLSSVSSGIEVEAVRGGRVQKMSISEVLVGEIVCLKIGDQVPADGLFVDGHSLKVDESSMAGEGDRVVEVDRDRNPFLLSMTKVTDGHARMVVTSVGMNTSWGEMMMARGLAEQTPLQTRLDKLTSCIGKVGLAVATLVLLRIAPAAVTIFVLAIPEALLLAVTLTLAYSTKRRNSDNAMVRKLSACETMGSATTRRD